MTAESFFLKREYYRIERNSTPPQIQATAEFQGLPHQFRVYGQATW
jgi:hypothetical protein